MDTQGTTDTGKWGEETAKAFLEANGYTILEQNWHSSHREVDIIARKGDVVAFVEVKTRTTTFASPASAVNRQKQKLLILAANHYMRIKNIDAEVRFDIISIVSAKGNVSIEHIPAAFYPRVW